MILETMVLKMLKIVLATHPDKSGLNKEYFFILGKASNFKFFILLEIKLIILRKI